MVDDVRAACDVLAPAFLRSGGEDGFVSIEVSPALAYDTQKSIEEAYRLFTAVDRPNVMIKIPGTREGVPAVLESLRRGLNINITLLFSLSQYEAVAEAYLDALEYRLRHDLTMRAVSSVASLFVSRVDTHGRRAARREDRPARRPPSGGAWKASRGRPRWPTPRWSTSASAAISTAAAWQLIAASGAKVQRLLWASTGTKDPAYTDVLYVDELIGEHTVTTLPEATWRAFNDHGTPARTVDRRLEEAHRTLRELLHLGIDMERVGAQLQAEGVEAVRQVVRCGGRRHREQAPGAAGARRRLR